jgi:hypothetical protein
MKTVSNNSKLATPSKEKKMNVRLLVPALAILLGNASAQTPASAPDTPKVRPRPALAPDTDSRRFVYTLSETDQGRKVNSRSFELSCREEQSCSMKTGSRVPVSLASAKEGGTQVQYMDVGLSVNLRYHLRSDGKLDLQSTVEMSNLATSTSQGFVSPQSPAPIVRQTQSNIDSVVQANSNSVLGMIEDLNSGHTYELSVIAKDR